MEEGYYEENREWKKSKNLMDNIIDFNNDDDKLSTIEPSVYRHRSLSFVDHTKEDPLEDGEEEKKRKRLKKEMREVVHHVKERKARYKQELEERKLSVREHERWIWNISPRSNRIWKLIKNKFSFLMLLLKILKGSRMYGMDKKVLTEDKNRLGDEYVRKKRNRWTIDPSNKYYRLHVIMLLLIMTYLIVLFPLNLAFSFDDTSSVWSDVEYGISIYFTIDICLSFITRIEKNHVVVDDVKEIAYHYLTRWFLLDLVSILPFELFLQTNTSFMYKRLFKLPRFLRLMNTLFQSTESKKMSRNMIIDRIKQLFSSVKVYYIVSLLLIAVLFLHIATCLWCFILTFEPDQNWLI